MTSPLKVSNKRQYKYAEIINSYQLLRYFLSCFFYCSLKQNFLLLINCELETPAYQIPEKKQCV